MKMHPILCFGAWVMHQIYLKDVHKSSYIVYVFHYKDIQYCIDPLVLPNPKCKAAIAIIFKTTLE
jgi:hypothetical protein